MDTNSIIERVVNKLEIYSGEVQTNLKKLTNHFNNEENLSDIERTATQISFWRSMDDKSCSAMIERIIDDEYNELDSKFNRFSIFSNWNDCITWDEIFDYTQEDETLANELENELEVCYLQWFVKNWYEANGHLSKNVEYFIIENNSVRNFDLKRFNFTNLFKDHKGIQRPNPFYNNKLTDIEIRKRVLMDMVDHTYNKPLVRKLKKDKKVIEFWYSKCELIIRKLVEGDIPQILLTKKMKATENKHQIKREYLMLITKNIDELIDEGYTEIE